MSHQPSILKLAAQLEVILRKQIEAEGKLLELLNRKQLALRQAKPTDIGICCELENAAVKQITELEKQRLTIVAEITLLVKPDATEPMKMVAMASCLPEPLRGRLLVLRAMLREKAEHVREQLKVTKQASEKLLQNMHSMVQRVTATVQGAGTYSRPSVARQKAMSVSTFSTTV